MDWQIVDPDPGLNYNSVVSIGNPHFEMEKKYIYITAVQIIARLIQFFHLKLLSSFDKMQLTNNQKMF